jgi:hypothetical protein
MSRFSRLLVAHLRPLTPRSDSAAILGIMAHLATLEACSSRSQMTLARVWLPTPATWCNAGDTLTHSGCHGVLPCEGARFATPKAYPRSGQALQGCDIPHLLHCEALTLMQLVEAFLLSKSSEPLLEDCLFYEGGGGAPNDNDRFLLK